ncbi:hypothetical protein T02_13813 [Trichinella nativa]|uniref:Uncharacterized protein n=1 Tax=Trichinella nativa TaxID=6335 RepID=A0A0V1LCH9_9BILA|nr:hypothetical protein T02_13813 [Trichinella nativa]
MTCELLKVQVFCAEMKTFSFGKTFPPSRSRTSDLWMSELCVYSPPLYQLSYRRLLYFNTALNKNTLTQNFHSLCFKLVTLQLIIAGCPLVITVHMINYLSED